MLWFSTTRGAQEPLLAERVRRLRDQVRRVPTTEANYAARIDTLLEWGDDQAARGVLLVPQDVLSAFYRLPAPTPAAVTVLDRWVRVLSFLEDHPGKTGTLARVDRGELVAGRHATAVFAYTVGEAEIPAVGVLRIGQSFIANRPRLQGVDATLDSYVSFQVESTSAATERFVTQTQGVYGSIFGPIPAPGLRVTSGALRRGDRVLITVGDTTGGSRGWRPIPRDADDYRFLVHVDYDGTGAWVPAAMASVRILGDEAALINAVAPSVVAVGEPFAVRLRVEDQYWNPARFGGGAFRVSLNGKPMGEIRVPPGQYLGRLDGMRIDAEGGYRMEVASVDGRFACRTNPILVERSPAQRIWWGELHGHSGWEEGTGSVPRYYEYARDVAFLDFGSLTGHDLFLSRPGWEEIRRETGKANRPGSFVAYMGYEWTQTYDKGGHHNVFFKTDKGRYVSYRAAPRPNLLYEKLRAIDQLANVLIIPHAHEAGDWNFNDPELERLVEIYSMHGSFEYFGRRYLGRRHRVGLVAASDDHTGHPGYSPASTATRNGLAAVYAARLDRDGIWSAMKARATYATSNATRPVVRVAIAGGEVGGAVATGSTPSIRVRALGTAPIDHIDVIHNGEIAYRKDFLAPAAGDPAAVQIMLHTSTETAGDQVRPPRSGTSWGGWIDVAGARIQSIEPLGLDHVTDEFHQVDERRLWFTCKTRGDFDGVLLRLAGVETGARVTIRVSTLDVDAVGTGGQRGLARPPGPPSRIAAHQVSFAVADLAAKKGRFEITPEAIVFAQRVRADPPWDVAFAYRPAKPLVQDDYLYVRVVQMDGETAWVSPVFVGTR